MNSLVWLLLLVSVCATSYARQCNSAIGPLLCSHDDSQDSLIINSSELEAYDGQDGFFWIHFNLSGIVTENPFVKVFLNDCQLGNEFYCEFVDKDICTIKWSLYNIQLNEDNTKVIYNMFFTSLGNPQCFSSLNLSVIGIPALINFTWKIDKCEGIILTFEAVDDDTSQWMECILLQQPSKKEIYHENSTNSTVLVPAHVLPKDLISPTNNESLSIEVKACNPAGCSCSLQNVSYGKEIFEYSVNDKLVELVLVNGSEFRAKITIKKTKCVLTIPKYFNISSNCSSTNAVTPFYTDAEKCIDDFFVILFPLRHGCVFCSFSITDNGGHQANFNSEIKTFHIQNVIVLSYADAIFFVCQFLKGSSLSECLVELQQISNESLTAIKCCAKELNQDSQIALCNITNLAVGRYNVTIFEKFALSTILTLFDSTIEIHGSSPNHDEEYICIWSQLVGPLSIVSTGGVIINLIISVILLIKFITVRPHSDPTDVKTSSQSEPTPKVKAPDLLHQSKSTNSPVTKKDHEEGNSDDTADQFSYFESKEAQNDDKNKQQFGFGRESANSKANTGTGTGTIVDKSTEYFSGYASYNMHESETNL